MKLVREVIASENGGGCIMAGYRMYTECCGQNGYQVYRSIFQRHYRPAVRSRQTFCEGSSPSTSSHRPRMPKEVPQQERVKSGGCSFKYLFDNTTVRGRWG